MASQSASPRAGYNKCRMSINKKPNIMKILVTGGAGFIGSAVVRHILADTDHTVINLDCLTYAGNLESIPAQLQSQRYCFEQGGYL